MPALQRLQQAHACACCSLCKDASATLRASALLALCKLMCLDAAFCDTNLQLIFTLLHNR